MLFGIRIGQLVKLVNETRKLENDSARLAVSGSGAAELAAALTAGGESRAVLVDGDPRRAAVAIRIVDGEPTSAETAVLRGLARAGSRVIVVRRGTARIPYVLPRDVIDAGAAAPVAELAAAVARVADGSAASLAARLPVIRPAVERRLIATTALTNAVFAAGSRRSEADLPLLALAQSRMLLRLGLTRGNALSGDPKELAAAVGPSLAGSLGLGLVARSLVRRLPVGGPLVRAAVASAGTWVLGTARLRV